MLSSTGTPLNTDPTIAASSTGCAWPISCSLIAAPSDKLITWSYSHTSTGVQLCSVSKPTNNGRSCYDTRKYEVQYKTICCRNWYWKNLASVAANLQVGIPMFQLDRNQQYIDEVSNRFFCYTKSGSEHNVFFVRRNIRWHCSTFKRISMNLFIADVGFCTRYVK